MKAETEKSNLKSITSNFNRCCILALVLGIGFGSLVVLAIRGNINKRFYRSEVRNIYIPITPQKKVSQSMISIKTNIANTINTTMNDIQTLRTFIKKTYGDFSSIDKHYFRQRKWEIADKTPDSFNHFGANYPCLWGEQIVGRGTGDGNEDGVKYGCGLSLLQVPCIIYSIGGANNWDFEEAMYHINPKCDLYTFDATVTQPTPPNSIKHKVVFKKWNIGHRNDNHNKNGIITYTLKTMMKHLGHKHIDVFKIDVEGWEFPVFWNWNCTDISIGQILIEIHWMKHKSFIPGGPVPTGTAVTKVMKEEFGVSDFSDNDLIDTNMLLSSFEKCGFRTFHKETNACWPTPMCCAEYSLIQKKWDPERTLYGKQDWI